MSFAESRPARVVLVNIHHLFCGSQHLSSLLFVFVASSASLRGSLLGIRGLSNVVLLFALCALAISFRSMCRLQVTFL